jgi:ketosteroid isomerase-like protein
MPEPVVTRVAFKGRVPQERSLDERLVLKFPRLTRLTLRMGTRLPPRSRTRRDGVRRSIRTGWAAAARGDWELLLARYAPDVVWEIPEEFQALGFAPSYHGHDGVREGLEQFTEAFGRWELLPACALDLGERVLTLGRFHGTARASGIELRQEFSQLITHSHGLVVRDRFFYSWDQGFEAAELDPGMAERLPLERG